MLSKLNMSQKIRAGAALVMVFILVLATNMIDNHHFQIVKKTINTVYEDRLVAKYYIYKISNQLQTKRNAHHVYKDSTKLLAVNSTANDSIQYYIDKFGTTRLTEKEADNFNRLKTNLDQLLQYEQKLFAQNIYHLNDRITQYFNTTENTLDILSQIQIDEARRQVFNSNRAIETSNLISNIEIGALILIGFLIQLLIFIKPLK